MSTFDISFYIQFKINFKAQLRKFVQCDDIKMGK